MRKFKRALDKGTFSAQVAADMELGELFKRAQSLRKCRKLQVPSLEEFKVIIDEEIKKAEAFSLWDEAEDVYEALTGKGSL